MPFQLVWLLMESPRVTAFCRPRYKALDFPHLVLVYTLALVFLHFVGVGMKSLVSLAVLAVVILTESLYSWRSCRKRRSTARLNIRHDNKSMFIADIRLGSTVICEFPNILALIFFDYLNVNLFMTNWCKIYCMMLD